MLMNRYFSRCAPLHLYLNANYELHGSKAIICFLLDMHLGSIFFPPFSLYKIDKDGRILKISVNFRRLREDELFLGISFGNEDIKMK